jgi:3-isopropylmalate dehydrogenase
MMLAFLPAAATALPHTRLARGRCSRAPGPPRRAAPVCAAVRGSRSNPYRIAVLPGDGAGPAVAAVATDVLGALADLCELHFDFQHADYGAPAFDATGSLVPWKTVEACRSADAVLRSYQGSERGDGRSGSAHRQLLAELGLFAQLRPVVVYPELDDASTLRPEVVDSIDIMLVREVSGGALGIDATGTVADAASAAAAAATAAAAGATAAAAAADATAPTSVPTTANGKANGGPSEARSEVSYTRDAVERIASVALQVAERRSGRILNVDKADVMSVSRFWRTALHSYFDEHANENGGISLEDMYVDDFVREVILRPAEFDTIVTSNLFGDIVAEVIAALAGPARIAPSVWVSRDGLGVYGPADIYNPVAYPRSVYTRSATPPRRSVADAGNDWLGNVSPVAMIRSASMMLRYALEEPAAADLIQQALRKTFADIRADNAFGGLSTINPEEFGLNVMRNLQLNRQFEQLCPPEICGE